MLQSCFAKTPANRGTSRRRTSTGRYRSHAVTFGTSRSKESESVPRRLARELPVAGLPTASDTLSRGCEIVMSDDATASELAALFACCVRAELARELRMATILYVKRLAFSAGNG